MKANLYATFRLQAGVKSINLEPGADWTIKHVADEIVRRCPDLRRLWLNEAGELQAHVHIFLNGSDVQTLPEKLSSKVGPQDTLDFFPPTAGG
ncbi:MAG: ubiquitin-like small modifier protein 1 [Anaerolineaceae bacterium]